jgi:hypothetical protein
VLFGGAALISALEGLHWHNLVATDTTKHNMFYGPRCSTGDRRLCAYDITVTNREADTANALRNAGIGLGVTAAVLGAGGLVLFFTAPKKPPPPADGAPPPPPAPAVSLACGPAGGLGLICNGAF